MRIPVQFGVVFDGYRKYERFSTSDASRSFVRPDPSLDKFKDGDIRIKLSVSELVINGSDLVKCCTSEDYHIYVGNRSCNITSLTETAVVCSLPDDWSLHLPALVQVIKLDV